MIPVFMPCAHATQEVSSNAAAIFSIHFRPELFVILTA
jgi:hypothetical protein